jgi:hypothetical protein
MRVDCSGVTTKRGSSLNVKVMAGQARGRCPGLGKKAKLTVYMLLDNVGRSPIRTDGKRRGMCSSWDSLHACASVSLMEKMSKETGREIRRELKERSCETRPRLM